MSSAQCPFRSLNLLSTVEVFAFETNLADLSSLLLEIALGFNELTTQTSIPLLCSNLIDRMFYN
ncbi:hypothetical protein HMPREF9129_1128 [Peptoniphilus indolicus ATCC 29427]|uniref:Uncharacterized protein n=1 Tax=Peptoniphilus indolicus ATCC 29427 TaxID=997350 RepID=G4D3Z8_9FIRM|nr:hypothetical protein HMPREF9129_1128 [Peptoniphilus indolicus ATCC 29427]